MACPRPRPALPPSWATRRREHPGSAGRPLPGVRLAIDDVDADGVGEIVVETPRPLLGLPRRAAGSPHRRRSRSGPATSGRLDVDGRLYVVDRRTRPHRAGRREHQPGRGGGRPAGAPGHRRCRRGRPPGPGPRWRAGRSHRAAGRASRIPATPPWPPTPARRSPGFKVPAAFVRLDALPRTAGGKLRREAVRALVAGEPRRGAGTPRRRRDRVAGDRVRGRDRSSSCTARSRPRPSWTGSPRRSRSPGDVTVHALDRRGSGSSRLVTPRPLDIAVHVADVVAYLDARGIDRAALAGVSFGGVRRPRDRRPPPGAGPAAVVAYEPPYGVARRRGRTSPGSGGSRADTAAAHAGRGPAAAAETFLRAVAGDAAWDRLPPRARAFLEAEGDGALADSGLTGLDPDGLARIVAPVTILTGGASDAFYAPLADALAARIPGARSGYPRGPHAHVAHHAARRSSPRRSGPAWSPPHDRPLFRPTTRPPAPRPGPATPQPSRRSGSCSTGSRGRYDLMNLLICAFQEPRWRRRLVDHAGRDPAGRRGPRRRERHGQGRGGPPRAGPAVRARARGGPLARA